MKPTPRRKSVWQERMPRRKRSLLKSSRVQEEVEEKSGDRRSGLRQAKEAKRKDNSVTNGIWYVTCENKEGVMDIEKLKRGESCIKCDGLWFTPPAFEEFAGRGACKKWKASIFHERRPLIHWFDKGILSTTGYLRRGAEPVRQKIKSTKSAGKFQGILRNKYLRSSTAVTRRSMSSGGCSATEKAEITSREDSGAKGDSQQSDEDDKLNDDPNQMETEDGAVLAAVAYSKDHNGTKERHKDVDLVKTKKPELQIETKVIIKRLSVTKTESGATVLPVEDSWCEPLEANVPSEEPEDDTAVPEADGEGTVKELNSSSGVSTTPADIDTGDNGDKTGLSAAPLNVLLECVYNNTDEGKTEHDKAEVETSGKCVQVADYPRASERVQDGASGGPEGADVDALDLDQLKREKLKLQLRVLRLQERYYTLMLNDFKK